METAESDITTEGLTCDAALCTRLHPSKPCLACKAAYYCSDQCLANDQVAHHSYCQFIRAKEWDEVNNADAARTPPVDGATISIPSRVSSEEGADSVTCSICLEDPNQKVSPVVTLEACKHMFCLPCLIQWQRKSTSYEMIDPEGLATTIRDTPTYTPQSTDFAKKSLVCPSCRSQSDHPEDFLLHKAREACARARHPGCPLELQSQLLNEAFMISSALLQVPDPELGPMLVLAEVLLAKNRPKDAIATTRRLIQMDRERHALHRIDPNLAWVVHARDLYDATSFDAFMASTTTALTAINTDADAVQQLPPVLHGVDRMNVYQSVFLIQGDAFQALGKNTDATRIYKQYVLALDANAQSAANVPPDVYRDSHTGRVSAQVWKGLSACYFEASKYDKSIQAADHAIAIDRSIAGTHQIKAKSLAKKALETASSRETVTELIGQALITMNQGVHYEAPWDPTAKVANLNLYHSLQRDLHLLEST
jgi:tetratricopeptide (TPR) repeat protein